MFVEAGRGLLPGQREVALQMLLPVLRLVLEVAQPFEFGTEVRDRGLPGLDDGEFVLDGALDLPKSFEAGAQGVGRR